MQNWKHVCQLDKSGHYITLEDQSISSDGALPYRGTMLKAWILIRASTMSLFH